MNILDLYSYDYILPESQIAQYPTQPQHDCKLLYCKIDNDDSLKLEDKIFKNIVEIIDKDSQIYFNNSKVVPSRIYISSNDSNIQILGSDGSEKQVDSGELFWLRQISDDTHEFLVRPGSKLKAGTKIYIKNEDREYIFEILGNTTEGREVRISGNIYDILEKFGNMPLPPYIGYDKSKDNDYQPVFAKTPGSVASPTASLHFTDYVMDELDKRGIGKNFVTLHVGMGTFKSVDSEDITKHNIHGEIAEIDIQIFQDIYIQKFSGQKIISVGTTSARTMESLPYLFVSLYDDLENKNILTSRLSAECIIWWKNLTEGIRSDYIYNIKKYGDSITFETRIYIYPGYTRIIVDNLVTNFHLPKSSLMMLVASKMGYENMMKAYTHAIDNDYRFYSFGDAMYIEL